jgi:hypothetical protein
MEENHGSLYQETLEPTHNSFLLNAAHASGIVYKTEELKQQHLEE